MAAQNVIRSIRTSVLISIAFSAMAITGSGTASADGLSCQTGCVIDYDGTAGSFDSDGTNGESRSLTTASNGSHSSVLDACSIVGAGCIYGASDPSTIATFTGVSDKTGSVLDTDGYQAEYLDTDGYQAEYLTGPAMVAVPLPQTPAQARDGGHGNVGFYN
jgi:hypothetical protein